ncbi:hypothetical protein RIF29_06218 [Crotalaria pallida]|uniref:Uncharacterized protein n=1 Tax=Crotalaria pallida TaxID=3830 RepID=A0AAN9J3R0_CROPI
MHSTQRREQQHQQQKQRSEADSFVIQIRGTSISDTLEAEALDQSPQQPHQQHTTTTTNTIPSNNIIKFNFSAMKLFHRFRKVLMRLMFSVPSPANRSSSTDNSRQRNSHNHDRFEPPKTSCSSYYSSYSHYNEAIADCIEFFNKSSAQDGFSDGRKSDVV